MNDNYRAVLFNEDGYMDEYESPYKTSMTWFFCETTRVEGFVVYDTTVGSRLEIYRERFPRPFLIKAGNKLTLEMADQLIH